jgi:hypothetical protein
MSIVYLAKPCHWSRLKMPRVVHKYCGQIADFIRLYIILPMLDTHNTVFVCGITHGYNLPSQFVVGASTILRRFAVLRVEKLINSKPIVAKLVNTPLPSPFKFYYCVDKNSKSEACVAFLNVLGLLAPRPTPHARGPLLIGCPRLLITRSLHDVQKQSSCTEDHICPPAHPYVLTQEPLDGFGCFLLWTYCHRRWPSGITASCHIPEDRNINIYSS